MLALAAISLVLLITVITAEFIAGTLSDNRLKIEENILKAGIQVFPDSGRMLARLARAESRRVGSDLGEAETYAVAAVEKSPNDYRNRLLLASIKDWRGDQNGAEQVLQDALALAPRYSVVHWRMANLQLREQKLNEAINHFQTAVELDPSLTDPTLDIIWNVTGGTNITPLEKVVSGNPRGQITFARFLVRQNQLPEAIEILSRADQKAALDSWEVPQIIYTLISKNYPVVARELWVDLRTGKDAPAAQNLIWNGDFETDAVKNFEHFDWHLTNSNFARVSVADKESHSGANALLVDFLGRDTTVLNTEVKQQIALRAGVAYQLEFYVRTQDFRSPGGGPSVVVSDPSGKWSAWSPSIASGDSDWHPVTFNFTAPRTTTGDGVTLLVTIKRQPKLSYDEPTRGRVWFDDFSLREARRK